MNSEEIWAQLAHATADQDGMSPQQRDELLVQALTVGSTIATDSVGCSITEMTGNGFRTPAASNALSLEIDQAQYAASDGPCVAACRDARIHSIAVMTEEDAYPGFTAAALERGVRSSLSIPLAGTASPSALNLYAGTASAFLPPHPQAVAKFLARCIATLVGASPSGPHRTAQSGTGNGDSPPSPVRLAVREVAEQHGTDDRAAFTELAARSRSEQRSILLVAQDVLGGSHPEGSGT